MRILIISRCPPYPRHLGDRQLLDNLTRYLAQAGHQIDLLAFANQSQDHTETEHYRTRFGRVQLISEPVRTPLHYLWRLLWPPARFPSSAARAWSPAMWRAIEQALARTEYDVVHLFGGVQVYEFQQALAGRPVLSTPYESYSLYLRSAIAREGGLMNRLRQWIAHQYEQFMFSRYPVVTVLAEPDRAEFLRANPVLDVRVIPLAIDMNDFVPSGQPRHSETILFVGNFEYPPNQDAVHALMDDIMPQVWAVRPSARLQLVGNGPPAWMQALVNEQIDVTGRVPDVQPYLDTATVFICPLRIGAGSKHKVLEAMAMAIPVIGTPLSLDGIGAVPGESVIVAPVEEMARAVLIALDDPSRCSRIGQTGREYVVQHHSWASAARQFISLYAELIRQSAPS